MWLQGYENGVPATLLGDSAKSICSPRRGKGCDSLDHQPGHGILALRLKDQAERLANAREAPW